MCGIAGFISKKTRADIISVLYTIFYYLRHGGQGSAGVVVERKDGGHKIYNKPSTIDHVFMGVDFSKPEWKGVAGVSHVHYSTSGVDFNDPRFVEEAERAAQPMKGRFQGKPPFFSYN